jgi:hypothetical protein
MPLRHDDEGQAVGETPFLVCPQGKQIEGVQARIHVVGNYVNPGVKPNPFEALRRNAACGNRRHRIHPLPTNRFGSNDHGSGPKQGSLPRYRVVVVLVALPK